MAEFTTLPSSPTEKPKRLISSSFFFSSPRLFTGFIANAKPSTESESVMSPTSTLDTKPFSHLRNPFSSEPNTAKARPWEKPGLGIADALGDEQTDPKDRKPDTRMVLFGSHLKIQIPLQNPIFSHSGSADFGIRTRNSHPGLVSAETPRSGHSGRVFSGSISATEMELSEDYTCVITHGPNPKTTHIFDDCVVESSCGVAGFSGARREFHTGHGFVVDRTVGFPSENFLSFCCTCKRNLGQDKDIYMYRGEKAFCSHECRNEGMLLEERAGKTGI